VKECQRGNGENYGKATFGEIIAIAFKNKWILRGRSLLILYKIKIVIYQMV
jgi:hypothetical protein